MTKSSPLLAKIKSPILVVGLFCLLLQLVGCNKPSNPDDVAIEFWTALAENDLEKAKKLSTDDSAQLFKERLEKITAKMRNASFQVGKVKYACDGATVETQITLQSAAAGSSFKTLLIRDQSEDRWKVDYPRTLKNIDEAADKNAKNIIATAKEAGKTAGESSWSFIKNSGSTIVDFLKLLKDKLMS